MAAKPNHADRREGIFSIDELESGLRLLSDGSIGQNDYWDRHILGFRRTVLHSIRETSDALLSPGMDSSWRILLERQLEALVGYVELADRYISGRALSPGFEPRASSASLH